VGAAGNTVRALPGSRLLTHWKEHRTHTRSVRTRVTLALACLTALVAGSGASAERALSADANELPGDAPVPFWPYETGALMGTSETYVDVHADGSYFDPSIGRRVVAAGSRSQASARSVMHDEH
jgi:hypothetical protein